jgi:hypothetical protein
LTENSDKSKNRDSSRVVSAETANNSQSENEAKQYEQSDLSELAVRFLHRIDEFLYDVDEKTQDCTRESHELIERARGAFDESATFHEKSGAFGERC